MRAVRIHDENLRVRLRRVVIHRRLVFEAAACAHVQDLLAVGRPRRMSVSARPRGQLFHVRAVRLHREDVEVLVARLLPREEDAVSCRGEEREVVPLGGQHLDRTVRQVHQPQAALLDPLVVIAPHSIHDRFAIGRPVRKACVGRACRQCLRVGTVGVHRHDLRRPLIAAAEERPEPEDELLAVRRPAGHHRGACPIEEDPLPARVAVGVPRGERHVRIVPGLASQQIRRHERSILRVPGEYVGVVILVVRDPSCRAAGPAGAG